MVPSVFAGVHEAETPSPALLSAPELVRFESRPEEEIKEQVQPEEPPVLAGEEIAEEAKEPLQQEPAAQNTGETGSQ